METKHMPLAAEVARVACAAARGDTNIPGISLSIASNAVAERDALQAQVKELAAALETIGGGWTNRFPGAPDVMAAESPLAFRSAMWTWSQEVARATLAKVKA